MTFEMVLWTVLVPFGVAAGVIGAFWWRAGREWGSFRRAAPTVAMVGALLVGMRALMGNPEWKPALAEGWLFHLAVLAGVAGLTLPKSRGILSAVLPMVGLAGFVLVVQLGRAATNGDMGSGATRLLWSLAVLASMVIPGVLLSRADRAGGTLGVVLAMGIAVGAAAGSIVLCNGIKLAQIEGLMGLALVPLAVVSWRGAGPGVSGVSMVFATMHGSLWWLTYYYQGDMPILALALNIAGPAGAALLPMVFTSIRKRPVVLTFAQAGMALAFAAASVGSVLASRAHDDAAGTDPYAGY